MVKSQIKDILLSRCFGTSVIGIILELKLSRFYRITYVNGLSKLPSSCLADFGGAFFLGEANLLERSDEWEVFMGMLSVRDLTETSAFLCSCIFLESQA